MRNNCVIIAFIITLVLTAAIQQTENIKVLQNEDNEQVLEDIDGYEKEEIDKTLLKNKQTVENQIENNECNHGKYAQQKCQCQQTWIGLKCQNKVIQVFEPGLYSIGSNTEYYKIPNNIRQIIVDWQSTQVLQVLSQNGTEVHQIQKDDLLFKIKNDRYKILKVTGKMGNIIIFNSYSIKQTEKDILNFMLLLPYFSVLIIYLIEKCKKQVTSSQESSSTKKFKISLKITDNNTDDCSICLMNEINQKVILDCGHAFHQACLVQWLEMHENCPYCRKLVIFDKN